MSIQPDSIATEIAARIRRERKARGWTLIDLAEKAGVSRAMISKVERCEASPTATVIGRLSAAFGQTMSELLSNAPLAAPSTGVLRECDMPVWHDPETGYVRRQIATLPDWPTDITLVHLPPGQQVAFPAEAFEALRHLIHVRKGSLRFDEGETTHRLQTGDRLIFGSGKPCTYRNDGHEAVEYLVIVSRL